MYYKDMTGENCRAEKRLRTVEGQKVTTWTRDVTDCNCFAAEAGTNGYQGGDWGHGSRTVLNLRDLGGTDCYCVVDGERVDCPDEIELVLGGDSELATIKEALRWWLTVLEAQSE